VRSDAPTVLDLTVHDTHGSHDTQDTHTSSPATHAGAVGVLDRQPARELVPHSHGEAARTDLPSRRPLRRRLQVLVWTVAAVAALYGVQAVLFPNEGIHPVSWWEYAYWALCVLWVLPVLPGVAGFIGNMQYRWRDHRDAPPVTNLVVWRIVSRGQNREALWSTVVRCEEEMRRNPKFPYLIEVVTDLPVELPEHPAVSHLQVPDSYRTPRGSLFKARALQYALENSSAPDDAWIVHLDEETQPTASGIDGIAALVAEEEAAGTHRIGQGCILYHRDWRKHPFLTLADMVRTGDDLSRFHFQHRLGLTVFGMHGSYIVVRSSVAKEVGFDVGPEGSITEDAFWALMQMQKGRRARWCDGYLEEQSTQSVADFVKQRRRWFLGLALVSLRAPVGWRWRWPLALNTAIWALAPLGFTYTVVHLFYGTDVPGPVRALANIAYATFAVLYLMGLQANLDEHGIRRLPARLGWYAALIVLLPVFSVMEAAGVIYAVLRPEAGFHVVKK
jgi:egghead protein (zeste-white 4 protein)